jgi:hypothetical protein
VSVPVSLDRLREQLEAFGSAPYLLTVGDDSRPHAVGVVADWADDRLAARVGRRSAANASARSLVSLVWPPHEPGGYTLIVDGDADVTAGVDGDLVFVTPTKAVLHRAAAADGGTAQGACTSDCVPLITS